MARLCPLHRTGSGPIYARSLEETCAVFCLMLRQFRMRQSQFIKKKKSFFLIIFNNS